MLSRLASARNTAEQAGLEETAQRIDVLRRELSSFKDLPAVSRAARAAWAISKVDETRASMQREAQGPREVLKDRQVGHDTVAITTKILLSAAAFFSGLRAMLSDPAHPIMLASAFVIGTVVGAGIFDSMIGSKDEKDAAVDIGFALDAVRKELACRLWKK